MSANSYGLDLVQFKGLVVRPALVWMGPKFASDDAVNLVTGTACAESRLMYLAQIGGGPARSLHQMEEVTFNDMMGRYLPQQQPELYSDLVSLFNHPTFQVMSWDLFLGAVMCRVRYLPGAGKIPSDAEGLCAYWKRIYNTSGGAGTVDGLHVSYFADAIAANG